MYYKHTTLKILYRMKTAKISFKEEYFQLQNISIRFFSDKDVCST